jgi:deferrochelatase/peroxidase EfeB
MAAAWGSECRKPENGGVLLQVCSDSVYINEHALRRVEHELSDVLQVAWTQPGSQRHTSRAGRTSRREGRALTGFLDGTPNLDPRHSAADAKLVFGDPDTGATRLNRSEQRFVANQTTDGARPGGGAQGFFTSARKRPSQTFALLSYVAE